MDIKLLILSLVAAASAAQAQTYSIVPIPCSGATFAAGEEVNDLGVVGGGAFDSADLDGGFRFSASTVTPMPALSPGKGVYGNSINNGGVVAGYAFDSNDQRRAVVWDGTTLTNLGTLGGDRSNAFGINNGGVVVGSSRDASAVNRPFSWTSATGMVELPISLGGTSASARAINDAGLIAGTARNSAGDDRAVLFNPATRVTLDLGTLGGASSFANGISPNGLVAGLSDAPDDEFRPFFWSNARGLVDLFAAGNLGQPFGAAYDVNSAGQVVGYGEIDLDFNSNAFVWSQSAGLQNLNSLIAPETGWELLGASGINEAGQITGWGRLNGVPTAYLLTVIPEPATLSLLVGAGVLALRRRK